MRPRSLALIAGLFAAAVALLRRRRPTPNAETVSAPPGPEQPERVDCDDSVNAEPAGQGDLSGEPPAAGPLEDTPVPAGWEQVDVVPPPSPAGELEGPSEVRRFH